MDLPGDAGALVEEVGPALLGLQLLALGQQRRRLLRLDPVRAPVAPDDQAAEHDRRQSDQRAEALAKSQPADLDREYARSGHGQGCREAVVDARSHRRHEHEGHHGRAAAACAAREPRGDGDHPTDHGYRPGAISRRGRRVCVHHGPGQQGQAEQDIARDLNRQGEWRARRGHEERQQAEPHVAQGAGQPVERARHASSIGRDAGTARQPEG